MKKNTAFLLAVAIIVCGVMTPIAQAEHYGALRSFLSPGEISAGLGGGVEHDEWEGEVFRHKVVYGKADLGLGREWAVGLRAGVEDMDNVTGDDFSSGLVPFIGGTVGGPLYQGTTLAIGPVVQASYVLQPFDSDGVEIKDMMKVSATLLAQIEIEGASLYLGPAFTLGDATIDGSDIELDNRYSGVVGIRWRLPDNWPTSESKTFFDVELATNDFQLNRSDLTLELNVTF